MSPQRKKILIGLLVLGLLAVGIDWLLLGGGPGAAQDQGPEAPPADDTAADIEQASDAPAESAGDDQPPAFEVDDLLAQLDTAEPTDTLDQRLEALAYQAHLQRDELRDAFVPDPRWHEPERDAQRAKDEPEPEDEPDPLQARAEQFQATHQLQAVMPDRDQGMAVVSGRMLRVGDSLDGFTLVRTGSRQVVFEADSYRITLSLPRP